MSDSKIGADPIGFVLEAAWAELTKRGYEDRIHRLRDYCACGEWGSAMVLAVAMELDTAKRQAIDDALWDKDTKRPSLKLLDYANWVRLMVAEKGNVPPDPPPRKPEPSITLRDIDLAFAARAVPQPAPVPKPVR